VDLGALAGDTVDLSLSIAAEKPGTIGLWGAPVVRSRTATAGNRPQGVIFILADTLRRDHLDAYGYGRETAPVLRRLASEGALFRDSVTQATWTKVSTPSIMTGLYPTSHGVAEFFDRLPGAANTLAEALRDAGYATLSLSSVAFSGKLTNLHKGFEQLHESSSLPEPSTVASKTAREYVDRLLPWLEAHREGPFFVFLHIFDPHDPYEPHRPYNTLWGNGSRRAEHQRQVEDVRKLIADPLLRLFAMPTREEILQAGFDPDAYIEQERDWYDGSIRAMDVEIGRLVERLRDLGLDEKTLIVFTSDHGEEFLDHGRMFHGQNVYGELTQVPLLFWWPGRLPAGTVVDETVQTIDVMPTILEMAGLPLPAGIQGRSLVPVLTGGASPRAARPAISEKAATADGALSPPPRETESVAIVVDGWKLIRNTRRAEGQAEFELYDHRTDPLNHADLAVAKPDVVARLAAELEAWKAKAEAARLPRDAEAPEELDAEVLERLRALGYVE
jgi:arylsulfatase A-like enzyme